MFTRTQFLRLSAAAAAGWVTTRVHEGLAAAAQPDSVREARIARVIETYDRQGFHRTGTAIDRQSAEWLRDEAARAGADVRLEAFTLDRVDPGVCRLETAGRAIEGLPLFDGSFTTPEGIGGRIGGRGSGADVLLVAAAQPDISSEGRFLAEERRAASYRAIVVVTNGAHPGLSPMNASAFAAPYGLPVLQVGSEHQALLDAQSQANAPVRFVAHVTQTRTEAYNVVAEVPGRVTSLTPVVVITPRSGWWHCASERGGGLACWLEAIRETVSLRSPRRAIFLASSGHELGHLGLDNFIHRNEQLVKGASAWVHLGANIGAAGGRPRLQSSDDEVEASGLEALTGAGAPAVQRVPRGTVPAGEARNIHVGGGRYLSLLGSSPRFHSEADRWPDAVDTAAVSRFAAGIASLLATLLSRV